MFCQHCLNTSVAAVDLARVLIEEGYPLEVVAGLRAIADAMIGIGGFEPYFRECVARAKEHEQAWREGYNLPARVPA